MRQDFKESDWKILRQLFPVALERFSQRTLDEVKSIIADNLKSFHGRYLAIFEESSGAEIKTWRKCLMTFDDQPPFSSLHPSNQIS